MVNLKKLAAALKTCNFVRWVKKDNFNYIMTDYFIIKTAANIEGSALTALIKLLGTIPGDGQGIQRRHDTVTEVAADEIKSTVKLLENDDIKPGVYTNLSYKTDKIVVTVFALSGAYIYINAKYTDLVDLYTAGLSIKGTGRVSPLYFKADTDEFMVLPVRIGEDPYYLKKLEDRKD